MAKSFWEWRKKYKNDFDSYFSGSNIIIPG
jgi:hypothetical protein